MNNHEFIECSVCAAQPGCPSLCESCLINRQIIEQLKQRIKTLERVLRIIKELSEYED